MARADTRQRGFSVAIIGPDGAGKTTICRRALGSLALPTRYVYMGINPDASNHMLFTARLVHWVKRSLGATPDVAGPPDPAREDRPPRNPLRRVARALKRAVMLCNKLADEWYRQCVIWFHQRRGNVVLFDRHFLFDFYSYDVSFSGRRPLSRRIHGFVLTHLYPRPDLVIVLDAPGEVLFARKGEGTPERLEERRLEYRRMGELVRHFEVVDATQSEDAVLREVSRRIEAHALRLRANALDQGRGTVLVTDAGAASALCVVRSLGRQGYRVIAVDDDPRAPGLRSRHAHESLVLPSPLEDPSAFAEELLSVVLSHSVDLVVPVSDASILALLEIRSALEVTTRLALPPTKLLQETWSKSSTERLARSLGIPVPRTRLVTTVAEACSAAGELSWPLVLKPQVSRLYREGEAIEKLQVSYANDEVDLARRISALQGRCPVLLQELHSGRGVGVELLMYEGRPLAAFQHERIREVPVTGGASSLRRSAELDPVLYEHSIALLAALGWTGLAMVEWKLGDDGPWLMEINGRIWGSLPLAVHCGMDFPGKAATLHLEGPPEAQEPDTDYDRGRRVRNLQKDLLWIGAVALGRRRYPFLDFPARVEAFRAALSLLDPRVRFDVLSLEDPGPMWPEFARIARKLRGKLEDED